MEVTCALARAMLELAGIDADPEQAISSGRALDAYAAMIRAQGGDPDAPLPQARHRREVLPAPASGWLTRLDALAVGVAAWRLGAGRARKEDAVSHTAGVICLAKPGDYVQAGQAILEFRADDPGRFAGAAEALDAPDVITIGGEPPPEVPLVLDDVGA
jgi:thymidine phosphorylase